ncbi:MAG TPA: helix-turn-helix transcriptional regulator [Caulobacteraceae bacterium]|nr:helix-turn-helix transcriptional regulator [Caulobacteraceae bacterium]
MTDDINILLGKRLRKRRRMLGLSQKDLADAIGIRFQQIQKYECASNSLKASRVWQLSKVLQAPVTYFFDGLPTGAAPRTPKVSLTTDAPSP